MANVKVYVEADVATWSSGIAAGAGLHLPVGDYSGADYRSAMRFPMPAGWGAWTAITKATITFFISDFQHVGPNSSAIFCSRMASAAPWTKGEGSQSCESGFTAGNTTQYDDIQSISTDRISFSSGSTANAAKTLDVTAAVRAYWGGNVRPVFVFDNNGSGQYTELWSRNKGGSYVAYLSIDYETNTPPTEPTLNSPVGGAVVQSDTPTLNFTPNDPQGDAHIAYHYQVAADAGFASLVEDLTIGGSFPNGVAINRVMANVQTRGATRYWRVQTSDASGYGPWSAAQSFSIKANPVVTISANRRMVYNGAPRLAVDWSSDQPQGQFRVTAPGYDSGVRAGADQSWTLDTLALTNGTPVAITVQVWNTDSVPLTASAVRSFTPRWGLTTHKKTLAGVPVNWQTPVVVSTVPAGASLVIEYGSAATAGAGAPTAWYPSIASVPKTQFLHWRAWFIPGASAGPTLDSINIPYDQTVATLDKWGETAKWPWENFGGIPVPFSVDTGESVYGTRSLRCDPDGVTTWHTISSARFKARAGRSYVVSGLMRSQGLAKPGIQLQSDTVAFLSFGAPSTAGALTEWARYKTDVWVAPTDMDVFFVAYTGPTAAAGSTAWWDGVKVEESIVATPWNPATVGATVVDAGGVQIDGPKGGLLRYKGTAGGLRDVVEGGANGLKFGGDANAEWSSPSADLLRTPGHIQTGGFVAAGQGISAQGAINGPYHLAGSGNVLRINGDGASSGRWARIAHGTISGQYWSQHVHGFVQGRYGTYEVAMSIGADAGMGAVETPVGLTARNLFDSAGRGPMVFKITIEQRNPLIWHLWFQSPGSWEAFEWHPTDVMEEGDSAVVDDPATLGWITDTSPWGGVQYLSSAYSHWFSGHLKAGGFIRAADYVQGDNYGNFGVVFESGVRLIQPAGQRIASGTLGITLTATTTTDVVLNYSGFSSPPAVSGIMNGGAVYLVALATNPTMTQVTFRVFRRDGAVMAAGTVLLINWLAIGPAA